MAPLLRLALPLLLLTLVAAQKQQRVGIFNGSAKYTYLGCYNETTDIAGSDRSRALAGGTNQVRRGEMTVPLCLNFCGEYRYAGLEWSRCASSSLSWLIGPTKYLLTACKRMLVLADAVGHLRQARRRALRLSLRRRPRDFLWGLAEACRLIA